MLEQGLEPTSRRFPHVHLREALFLPFLFTLSRDLHVASNAEFANS